MRPRNVLGVIALGGLAALGCQECQEGVSGITGAREPVEPGTAPTSPAAVASEEHAPGDTPPGRAEPDLVEHMQDHFGMITQARDAVIRGELLQAQGPLIWLAQHKYAGEIPEVWRAHVDAMQAIATRARDAQSPEELGAFVADLAAQCGACHAAQDAVVRFEPAGFETLLEDDSREDTRARMHRHLWASERMWEALVGPDVARFRTAVSVLRDAPAIKGGTAAVRAGSAALRTVADKARQADTPEAMADAYGEFLGRCSSCHAAHAVKPGFRP